MNNQDFILHPTGYTGAGAALTVNLCIVPGSPNAAAMVTPVANIAATITALAGQTGNLSTTAGGDTVPFTSWDFESVALHEVGHCLGLAHTNAATESGLGGASQDYTKAAVGGNGVLNVAPGVDTIIGSSDDVRTDDVSVHWFRTGTADPCADPGTTTFDSTTYTVTGALPGGQLFPANADQSVCAALGSANTEAVMQQGSPNGQGQRRLGHDDEAMLRLGMSGLDETQGTADDYTLTVVSLGVSSSASCDVNISFNNAMTGFAVCQVGFSTSLLGNADHGAITSANSFFNTTAVTWFFNTTPVQLQSFSVD
ncbi:MAG: matrixin family metalloprotease [Acidobacteriota bacterium]